MRKLKIGMLNFAHSHAFSYYRELRSMEGVEIAGICHPDRQRVQKLINEDGIFYTPNSAELLSKEVDAVIVCSENVLHKRHVLEAAAAGKHVLCEKPLGVTEEEMEEMIAACGAAGVSLMTAFLCRYLPGAVRAKRAVERGEVGEVLAIKGYNRGTMPGGWFVDHAKSGGGAILDHTVHVMDLMRWMTGREPACVYAEGGTLFHPIDVEDAGLVHVTLEGGIIGMIDTSWSRSRSYPYWGDVKMDIVGTKGVLHFDAFAEVNEVYSDASDRARWSYWGGSMNRLMLEDFVRHLMEGRSAPISGEDGLQAAKVALAAYASLRARDTIVL
ncbi:Gfo/Idh/MocA family protein [Saccharibacillus kuerlensis]|uniref:Dehydrogenase n=1 Tax=Saccharibacillus kuerlensis TaxID=459527 RepID=A0ABQ2L3S2_9BACL|nr:Gfo/Idh/MocA family oxidoreductase [Saccharibacillus kuerlensis]GGO01504.1 dehydrogenase [Saccharibacillus kuerlensis]